MNQCTHLTYLIDRGEKIIIALVLIMIGQLNINMLTSFTKAEKNEVLAV